MRPVLTRGFVINLHICGLWRYGPRQTRAVRLSPSSRRAFGDDSAQ
jgi:hypothetical protein